MGHVGVAWFLPREAAQIGRKVAKASLRREALYTGSWTRSLRLTSCYKNNACGTAYVGCGTRKHQCRHSPIVPFENRLIFVSIFKGRSAGMRAATCIPIGSEQMVSCYQRTLKPSFAPIARLSPTFFRLDLAKASP